MRGAQFVGPDRSPEKAAVIRGLMRSAFPNGTPSPGARELVREAASQEWLAGDQPSNVWRPMDSRVASVQSQIGHGTGLRPAFDVAMQLESTSPAVQQPGAAPVTPVRISQDSVRVVDGF